MGLMCVMADGRVEPGDVLRRARVRNLQVADVPPFSPWLSLTASGSQYGQLRIQPAAGAVGCGPLFLVMAKGRCAACQFSPDVRDLSIMRARVGAVSVPMRRADHPPSPLVGGIFGFKRFQRPSALAGGRA